MLPLGPWVGRFRRSRTLAHAGRISADLRCLQKLQCVNRLIVTQLNEGLVTMATFQVSPHSTCYKTDMCTRCKLVAGWQHAAGGHPHGAGMSSISFFIYFPIFFFYCWRTCATGAAGSSGTIQRIQLINWNCETFDLWTDPAMMSVLTDCPVGELAYWIKFP